MSTDGTIVEHPTRQLAECRAAADLNRVVDRVIALHGPQYAIFALSLQVTRCIEKLAPGQHSD